MTVIQMGNPGSDCGLRDAELDTRVVEALLARRYTDAMAAIDSAALGSFGFSVKDTKAPVFQVDWDKRRYRSHCFSASDETYYLSRTLFRCRAFETIWLGTILAPLGI